MRTRFFLPLIALFLIFAASCSLTKKSSSGNYFDKLYASLRDQLPEAQVSLYKDTVRVVYPEIAMFDFGSDQLKAEAKPSFTRFAGIIREYPDLKIVVNGYTDNIGPDDVNRDLSTRRAETGKQVLTDNGIEGSRITTHGYGADHPIMSNATDQGRTANRRVEFLIYRIK